jgi:hypothetical protein
MLNVVSQPYVNEIRTVLSIAEAVRNEAPVDRVVLDIWRAGGHVHPQDHLGYWTFGRTDSAMRFGINPGTGRPAALNGTSLVDDQQWTGTLQPGDYTASLALYDGDKLVQTITDIYTFSLEANPSAADQARQPYVVRNLQVRSLPILFY